MESAKAMIVEPRNGELESWLRSHCGHGALTALAGDASFRCYYRYVTPNRSYVVMDSSAEYSSYRAFAKIAKELLAKGLTVPEIIARRDDRGWLILSDFGDQKLLDILTLQNADALYKTAIQQLIRMQVAVDSSHLHLFDKKFMSMEWEWHKEWFIKQLLGIKLSDHQEVQLNLCVAQLLDEVNNQPKFFMHRDYQSANLMQLANQQLGILDFQDAFRGPYTYDLASLLHDSYVSWPPKFIQPWALYYKNMAIENKLLTVMTDQEFILGFDFMSVQRLLKALITFARKYKRDNNDKYLKHIPQAINYLISITNKYSALSKLNEFFTQQVKPIVEGRSL